MTEKTSMKKSVKQEEYLNAPCKASSLPFWKTEQIEIPSNIDIYREDEFDAASCVGRDEPYFKLMHNLLQVPDTVLQGEYVLSSANLEEFASHIGECYTEEGVTVDELKAYTERAVYDSSLWIAVRDRQIGRIVASGIAEVDSRIGEGVLEWIQVSPDYRRRGLGRFVVCELLKRLSDKAKFVTVSGKVNSAGNPLSLYKSCGFGHEVIWHIVNE